MIDLPEKVTANGIYTDSNSKEFTVRISGQSANNCELSLGLIITLKVTFSLLEYLNLHEADRNILRLADLLR